MTMHEPTRSRGVRHALAGRLLPHYAASSLPGPLRRFVRGVLDDDVELAARYHVLRRLERSVHGPSTAVSAAQEDLMLAGVLAGLDDVVAPSGQAGSSLQLQSWSSVLAAAAAVVMMVMADDPTTSVRSLSGQPSTDLRLQARGDVAVAPVGLRVRCLDAHSGGVRDQATAGARQRVGGLSCADDGLLAFSVTNLSPQAQHLFVVGVDDEGAVVFLPPFTEGSQAVAVAASTVDAVLDRLAPMPVLDGRGLTLHVLVDDAPFAGHDVARRLQMASVAAVPLWSLDRLPVDVETQARLNLYRESR
jgi:hypothetical protein